MSLHLNLSKYAAFAFWCYGNMTEKVSMKEERFMLAPGSRVLTLLCCSWAVVRWYPWWEYVGSNAAHSVAVKKLRERREGGERDRDSQSEKQIQRGTETGTGERRRKKEEKKRRERRMRRMKRKNWVEWRDGLGLNPFFQDMILMTELPPPPYLLRVPLTIVAFAKDLAFNKNLGLI